MSDKVDRPHLFLPLGVMISLTLMFGCFYLHHLTGIFLSLQLSHDLVGMICDSASSDLEDSHEGEHDFALASFDSGGMGAAPETRTQPTCQADQRLSISPLRPPPRFG